MHSLFWRIFATFWLALVGVAGLASLFATLFSQDAWILTWHSGIRDLPAVWCKVYEKEDPRKAQVLLQQFRTQYHIGVQIYDNEGVLLAYENLGPRPLGRHGAGLPRQMYHIDQDYRSVNGNTYQFVYRIPRPVLHDWQRESLLLPGSGLFAALVVITALSLTLTGSITRPLKRLREAIRDLDQTSYRQDSLARLAQRRDELGALATDFNNMGQRLQGLIQLQQQLLRDVSHELRSPLARLRVALALYEQAVDPEKHELWDRLQDECTRLDQLIGEILDLARLEAPHEAYESFHLLDLLEEIRDNALLLAPDQMIELDCPADLDISTHPLSLERAIDNLVRNALRYNPVGKPLNIRAVQENDHIHISVRDFGPGVPEDKLALLTHPFFRLSPDDGQGYGLGLTIARRCLENLGGTLTLSNAPQGGFLAELRLPTQPEPPNQSVFLI